MMKVNYKNSIIIYSFSIVIIHIIFDFIMFSIFDKIINFYLLGDMPPLPPIKELSSDELAERERTLRKLREELRSEEMKLVLLKKLRQSQQLKENIAAVPKVPSKLPPPVTVQPTPHR